MTKFFATLYEWFGLVPVYSHDMAEFLKGMDVSCTGYYALPWYFYIGLLMIVLTLLLFGLQYDLVSNKRFPKFEHWALALLVVVIVNFATAFTVPFVAHETGFYCPSLHITVFDCIGFGLSNAAWAVVFFSILNLVAKRFRGKGVGQ
jgi:hypothetical protein